MRRSFQLVLAVAGILAAVAVTDVPADVSQSVSTRIKEIEAFSYCGIPHSGSFNDLSGVLNTLVGALANQNIAPSGELIAIYHLTPTGEVPDRIEYEVAFPITAQVFPQPPLQKKEWHYTQVAFAVHRGDYDSSADTIDAMLDWIEARGYVQEGPILARFLVVPSEDVRTRDLRTEVWVPINKK